MTNEISSERLEEMIRTATNERNSFMANSWSWLRENDTITALTELRDRRTSAQETQKSMHVEGDVHREVVVTDEMAEVMLRFLQRPAAQLLTNTEAFRQGIEAALKGGPDAEA